MFNKNLSKLEAMFEVENEVVKKAIPLDISDFIHYVFDNPEKYKLEGITKEWFILESMKDPKKATNIIFNLLQENGFLISKKSILEGVEMFQNDNN